MKLLLVFFGLLMIIATLLPISRNDVWWIRSFDFPRLQIAFIISGILLIYSLFISNYHTAEIVFQIALTASLLYQGYMVYPYTPLASAQVEKGEHPQKSNNISLLFANVQMDNRNAEKLKEIISAADPDVILAVETDEWWLNQLKILKETYPYFIEQPQDNCYGMALFSRKRLTDSQVNYLVEDNIPSIHTKVETANGAIVELRCLHPRPPFLTGDETSTERDAELLIVGREIKDIDTPTIVLGDLNDVAWSRTNNLFQDISGLLDPRIGRGLFNTFHASYPFIRFPLDHSFHTHHFRLVDFQRLSYFGSDHFPVFIELSHEPDAKIKQDEQHADKEEQQESEEKIEKGVQ